MRNEILMDLYLGEQLGWVDVSGDVRQAMAHSGGGITITRTDRDAGTMDLVLANPGGKYSPRNPRSPYYGALGRNTPIRCGVEQFRHDFDGTLAATWGPGWTYAQFGDVFTPAQHGVDGGSAWHRVTTANGYRLTYWTDRRVADCEVRTTVSITGVSDVTGAALEPANIALRVQGSTSYYLARVEIMTDESVVVSLRHSSGTVIAGPVTVSDLTYSGQTLAVAASVVGDRLACKVWAAGGAEPLDWHASGVDSQITAAGYVGIRTGAAAGNTNVPIVARYDYLQVIDRRAHMEVSEWPPRWTVGGHDVWVPVRAEGLTRRLRQGAKPLASALTRYLPGTSPIAWWPLEDGQDSTRAASGLPGGGPLLGDGSDTGLGGEGPPGAASAMVNSGHVLGVQGPVPAGVNSAEFAVSFWTRGVMQDRAEIAHYQPVTWSTRGGEEQWTVFFQTGFEDAITGDIDPDVHQITVQVVTASATSAFGAAGVFIADGEWHLVTIAVQQQGADIAGFVDVDGVNVGSGWVTSRTLRAPDVIRVPGTRADAPPPNLTSYAVSHLQIHNAAFGPDQLDAGHGYVGEPAADRIERLCAEQGVPVLVTEGPDPSMPMGPQRPLPFDDLLTECADADGGIRGEAREQLALTYICRSALYNQAAVEVPYTLVAPPLEPVDDDALVRNDVEVRRLSGSSARHVVDVGPLSVLPPPAGVGTYDTSVTVNVASDDQLPNIASWLAWLGTWDEARYPTARVELGAPEWADVPDLAAAVTAADAGRVLALAELPEWLPPGPSAQMVRGSVEQIHQPTRLLEWTLVPAGPWMVGTADGSARAAVVGSTLDADIDADTTSIAVTTTGRRWTTNPASMPLDALIGGEPATVTAIAGTGSTQTFTVTRGVGGFSRAWPAGTAVTVRYPVIAVI